MNILLVNTLYHPNILGGAERSVQVLAEALVAVGNRVSVLTSSTQKSDFSAVVNGINVHYVRQRNVYSAPPGSRNPLAKLAWHTLDTFNPFTSAVVNQVLDRETPDLVHTNTLGGFSVSTWSAVRRRKLPLVHTLRDYYLLCPRTTMFRNNRNCSSLCAACSVASWPKRKASSLVQAVVGVSAATLNVHLACGLFSAASSKSVIHNALQNATAMALQDAAHPTGKIVFGYLGRLAPSKGLEVLLDAVKQLPGGQFEILVAGKGAEDFESDLKSTFSSVNIKFIGFVAPEELFKKIHFLIVPSLWHEPFPRTGFEAFSYGIPVIGARRGGIPELIEEGRTGMLFDPDHPTELLEILRGATMDVFERMRPHCVKKATEFSPEQIASKYLSVYDKVLHAGSSR